MTTTDTHSVVVIPSERSSIRDSQIVQEAYLHWYKSHPPSVQRTIGRILTEEPETEYLCEQLSSNTSCIGRCKDPYMKCFKDLKKIRHYRHETQNIFEGVYRHLRWIDLPGGQDLHAVDKNYWMHYMWLMTYVTNEVDATQKDSARHIRYRFEDVLYQAENLGIMLQEFFSPLATLARSRAFVEDIGELIQSSKKFAWLSAERKIMRLAIKPDDTMFSARPFSDFGKLLIYTRRDSQVWTKFQTLTEEEKVDIVSKGLMEISENIKELHSMLRRPLRAFKAAQQPWLGCSSCIRPTLIPHVKHMKGVIKKIVVKKDRRGSLSMDLKEEDEKEKKVLELFLDEVSSHYDYVLRWGELVVEEIWDIILMVRLCYNFVKKNAHNNLTVASYEALIQSKFKPDKRKKLLKPSSFESDDFYRVNCPETLRKLPIIATHVNTEICLHLHGHRNSHKSKVSASHSHKFSVKRWASAASPSANKTSTDTASNQERKTLMFVSEGES